MKSVFMKTGPDGAAAFDWLPVETQGNVRVLLTLRGYIVSLNRRLKPPAPV